MRHDVALAGALALVALAAGQPLARGLTPAETVEREAMTRLVACRMGETGTTDAAACGALMANYAREIGRCGDRGSAASRLHGISAAERSYALCARSAAATAVGRLDRSGVRPGHGR